MTVTPNPPTRVSSLSDAILAELPEYVELQACRDRQVSAIADLRALAAETTLDLDAAVLARLGESADPTAGELVDLATEVLGRREAFTLAEASLQAAGRSLDSQLNMLIEDRADYVFERMDSQLRDLIERTKALTPLAVAADPALAIKAGRSEDYEKVAEISKTYRALRTEQFRMLRRDIEHGLSAPTAAISNLEKVFPHWDVWLDGGALRQHGSRASRHVTPPWPIAAAQRFNLAVAEPRFLFWAVETGADLWIPTRRQLEREAKRLQDHFHGVRSSARPPRPGEWTDRRGRLVIGSEARQTEATGLAPMTL